MAIIKPVLRIFDYQKAMEFYRDWLGFKVDWEHTFEENMPVYMQISREDLYLHLSEHYGDGTPGSGVFIDDFKGLKTYHQQLTDKKYKYYRPGLEKAFWGENLLYMVVQDPFGNKLTFCGPEE